MGMNEIAAKMSARVPPSLQNHARYAYRLVRPSYPFGRIFHETYGFLQESQWWERERLEEYQLRQLKALLSQAYENVPYYRRVFNENGVEPKDIQGLKDLARLPFLTKDAVRRNSRELVAENARARFLPRERTSGTTGKVLHFYVDDAVRQKELAFVFHQWSRVGCGPGERRLELRGQLIGGKKPYEYDRVLKALRFSPRIDGAEAARLYLEKMEGYGAEYLRGYPSSVSNFAYLIWKHGLAVPFQLKAVILASGKVYPWQRKIVGVVFGCRVFSHYGQAERVVTASECEGSLAYHCCPQYGVTEIDPENGEIIGTGFLNYVHPFIRYRTGDVSSGVAERCEHCGREYYPLIEDVTGRLYDFVVTPRGLIGPSVFTYVFKKHGYVRESQIIQKDRGHVAVKVALWDREEGPDHLREIERLRAEIGKALGDEMRVDVELVDGVGDTEAGKFRWIVSDVARDVIEHGFE